MVAAGGTGELYSMTADEIVEVVRVTVQATAGRMPVVAGTGYVLLARIFTVLYFGFFILLPFVSKADGNGPVPERVTYHGH